MRIFRIYVQLGVSIQHFFFMRYSKKRIKIYQISKKTKTTSIKTKQNLKKVINYEWLNVQSRQKCLSTITHRCFQSFEGCLKDLTFISPSENRISMVSFRIGRRPPWWIPIPLFSNGRTCSTCWETIPIKHTQLQDSSRSHYYCVHSSVRLA